MKVSVRLPRSGDLSRPVQEDSIPRLSMGHHTAVELLRQACPSGVVVDAGAFPGTLTRVLNRHWNVIALDKAPDRNLNAQAMFHSAAAGDDETFADAMRKIGVDALAVDLETDPWPIAPAAADAVVLTEVIEHMYINPLHALLEVNRVLKPGGVLLISTPNLLSLRNRINFFFGNMTEVIQPPFLAFLQKARLGHCGHVRLYAPTELSDMLAAVGFESRIRFYEFGFWDAAPGAGANGAGSQPAAPPQRSFVRKLWRSPRSYVDGALSTGRSLLEQRIPQCRSHMYVIARKVRAVTDEQLSVAAFKATA